MTRDEGTDDDIQNSGFPGSNDSAYEHVAAEDHDTYRVAVFGQPDFYRLGDRSDRRARPRYRFGMWVIFDNPHDEPISPRLVRKYSHAARPQPKARFDSRHLANRLIRHCPFPEHNAHGPSPRIHYHRGDVRAGQANLVSDIRPAGDRPFYPHLRSPTAMAPPRNTEHHTTIHRDEW